MRQSGLGIASLVLGIVGFIFSILIIGIYPCIASIILSIIVLLNKNVKHSLAIAGLICSLLGVAVFAYSYFPYMFSNKEQEPQIMSFGETYTINDIFEFTPENGYMSPIIMPTNRSDNTSRNWSYYRSSEENDMGYELVASIKNIGTEKVSFSLAIDAEIIINNTYRFDANVAIESTDGTEWEYVDVYPLQDARTIRIYTFVPEEIWGICESCTMNLAFSDDYDSSGRLEYDPIYTITFDEDRLINNL